TSDAGSGAFGSLPGVVTISAGRNVTGHFVAADSVANGEPVASTITAGVNGAGSAGLANAPLALSLAAGGWQVSDPNGNIVLMEVRNPNGTFNSVLHGTGDHLFDYDPLAFLDLDANSVELVGSLGSQARNTSDRVIVPTTYPPSLEIEAGSGGIQF